jgi:hypothetical protein
MQSIHDLNGDRCGRCRNQKGGAEERGFPLARHVVFMQGGLSVHMLESRQVGSEAIPSPPTRDRKATVPLTLSAMRESNSLTATDDKSFACAINEDLRRIDLPDITI